MTFETYLAVAIVDVQDGRVATLFDFLDLGTVPLVVFRESDQMKNVFEYLIDR